jgi:hypothetical protein
MNLHEDDCGCPLCNGMSLDDLIAQNERLMEKYGWFYHVVVGEDGMDVHTHGLQETYNHVDLQITFPLHKCVQTKEQLEDLVHSILWAFAKRIDQGEIFSAGERVSEIIKKFDVKLVLATENNRPVLRIILPDAKGNLDKEQLTGIYLNQYEGANG